jgi:DNA replication protein DnaC
LPTNRILRPTSASGGADTQANGKEAASDEQSVQNAALVREPRQLYAWANVPKRHTRVIDETRSPREWLDTRDKIQNKTGSGFLFALIGPRGPGKTQLAQQVVLYASAVRRTSLYTRALTFFMEAQRTCGEFATEARIDVVDRYRVPDLLVIDEFQERGETPFENRMLNHLLDLRYGDITDTLLIANLEPAALLESVGESITERLREAGGIIECNWPSFRDPKKENTNGQHEQEAHAERPGNVRRS